MLETSQIDHRKIFPFDGQREKRGFLGPKKKNYLGPKTDPINLEVNSLSEA